MKLTAVAPDVPLPEVVDEKEDDVGPTGFSFCHGSLRAEYLCYEQCDCSSRKDSFDRYSHYFLLFLFGALAALDLGSRVMR